MSPAVQTRRLEIELPENAYRSLSDVAEASNESVEKYAQKMIYAMIECDLTGGGDLSTDVGEYICKRHGYDTNAWRRKKT